MSTAPAGRTARRASAAWSVADRAGRWLWEAVDRAAVRPGGWLAGAQGGAARWSPLRGVLRARLRTRCSGRSMLIAAVRAWKARCAPGPTRRRGLARDGLGRGGAGVRLFFACALLYLRPYKQAARKDGQGIAGQGQSHRMTDEFLGRCRAIVGDSPTCWPKRPTSRPTSPTGAAASPAGRARCLLPADAGAKWHGLVQACIEARVPVVAAGRQDRPGAGRRA